MGADTEVEQVLYEIRQHLRAESQARGANGADHTRHALAQIAADLTVTERAWSRLPPLQSERRGWLARLELWLKRRLKRAAHWFTWEQVNFNSAVHHTLRAAHAVISDHERQLAELRAEVERLSADAEELEYLRAEVERLRRDDGRDRRGSRDERARPASDAR